MHGIKPHGLKGHMNVENGFKAFNLLGQTNSKTITNSPILNGPYHTDKKKKRQTNRREVEWPVMVGYVE